MNTHRILINSLALALLSALLLPVLAGCAAPSTEAEYVQRQRIADAVARATQRPMVITAPPARPTPVVICNQRADSGRYSC